MDSTRIAEPKTAHTAGPWDDASKYPGIDSVRIFAKAHYIATVGNSDDPRDVTEANARLIAAAPDLLASCRELVVAVSAAMRVVADLDMAKRVGLEADTREKRFVDELHASGVKDRFGVRAKAAIAKAEGSPCATD